MKDQYGFGESYDAWRENPGWGASYDDVPESYVIECYEDYVKNYDGEDDDPEDNFVGPLSFDSWRDWNLDVLIFNYKELQKDIY